jgi:hypothetical protein
MDKRTALIVGAGAVENSWAPVIRVLERFHPAPLTNDGANTFMALLIYLLRWWSSNDTDLGKQQLIAHKSFLAEMRESISSELSVAQKRNEIRVRSEFPNIVERMLVEHSTEFMFVTTNWDTVVDDALAIHLKDLAPFTLFPLHIHGSLKNPDTLYLPTEVTKEPYRSFEQEQEIGGLHGSIMRGLESASRVVLYGISLSPLDAELNQTVAAGWDNPHLTEINIIAPNHKEIAQRVNVLLANQREIKVTGFEPSDLSKPTDYTVKGRAEWFRARQD